MQSLQEMLSDLRQMLLTEVIEKTDKDGNPDPDGRYWTLFTKHKPRRRLGTHPTKKAATRQEMAIKASQARRGG